MYNQTTIAGIYKMYWRCSKNQNKSESLQLVRVHKNDDEYIHRSTGLEPDESDMLSWIERVIGDCSLPLILFKIKWK